MSRPQAVVLLCLLIPACNNSGGTGGGHDATPELCAHVRALGEGRLSEEGRCEFELDQLAFELGDEDWKPHMACIEASGAPDDAWSCLKAAKKALYKKKNRG